MIEHDCHTSSVLDTVGWPTRTFPSRCLVRIHHNWLTERTQRCSRTCWIRHTGTLALMNTRLPFSKRDLPRRIQIQNVGHHSFIVQSMLSSLLKHQIHIQEEYPIPNTKSKQSIPGIEKNLPDQVNKKKANSHIKTARYYLHLHRQRGIRYTLASERIRKRQRCCGVSNTTSRKDRGRREHKGSKGRKG